MTPGDVVGTLVAVLVASVLGLSGLGRLRTRLWRVRPASGDPLLARVVDESPDRHVRRLAAAVVDGPAAQVRSCFLGADALGASVLGNALAHHAGVDYAGLLRARLTEPVGMAATTALRHDGPALPRGWRPDGRRRNPWRMPGYLPAGGVISTSRHDDADGGPAQRVSPRHGRALAA